MEENMPLYADISLNHITTVSLQKHNNFHDKDNIILHFNSLALNRTTQLKTIQLGRGEGVIGKANTFNTFSDCKIRPFWPYEFF